jgi:hypothetical protein
MKTQRHPEIDALLNQIAAYRLKTGIGRTQFGLIVANDGHFIRRLEGGRLPRLPTIDRVRALIRRKPAKTK